MSLEKENHVLIIYPHPDDEAFGVAGTIMTYRRYGRAGDVCVLNVW